MNEVDEVNDFDAEYRSIYKNAHEEKLLTWYEFSVMIVILLANMQQIILHLELHRNFGSNPLFIFQILIIIFVNVPCFLFFSFFGIYGRRSFVRFWDVFPVFKGISYTMSIILLGDVLVHANKCTLALAILPHCLKVPVLWETCNFTSASRDCVPMDNPTPRVEPCCENVSNSNCHVEYIFSTLNFFQDIVSKIHPTANTDKGKTSAMFLVFIVWIVVLIVSYMPIKMFAKLATSACHVMFIVVMPYVFYIIYVTCTPGFKQPSNFATESVSMELIKQAFLLNGYIEGSGEIIYYGSITTSKADILSASLFIYGMKITILALSLMSTYVILQLVADHYGITDTRCINLSGFSIFFGLTPDFLTRTPFPNLVLMVWIVMLFLWNFMKIVLVVYSLSRAILESNLTGTQNIRVIKSMICLCALILNCTILDSSAANVWKTFIDITYAFILPISTGLHYICIGLYSFGQIETDFHFLTGRSLSLYWSLGLKGSVVMSSCFALVTVINASQDFAGRKYVGTIVTLLMTPFACVIIYNIVKFWSSPSNLFTASKAWGRPMLKQRVARRTFAPKKFTKSEASKLLCKHICLLDSERFEKECLAFEQKFKMLEKSLWSQTADDFYKRRKSTWSEL